MSSPKKKFAFAATPIVIILLACAAFYFKPWTAFTSSTIDQALPTASAPAGVTAGASATASPTAPRTLASGSFVSQDHTTSGDALFVEVSPSETYLRLENFSVDNGPDLKVVISPSEQDLKAGRYTSLGPLQATNGNQNYVIPPTIDLATTRYVTIWCERFSSPFGSASLT